jgi:hypothetical protein
VSGRQLRLLDGHPLDELSDADRIVELSQYDTPPELAARQALMLPRARRPLRVLEPSAGLGALVRAVLERSPSALVDAVEYDPRRVAVLRELACELGFRVDELDYLERPPPSELYDVGISNPPFTDGIEEAHVCKLMAECRRLLLQLPIRSLHGKARTRSIWSRVGREWWLRAEVRISERCYPNASDDVVLVDLRREPGPCVVSWWAPAPPPLVRRELARRARRARA